MLYLVILEEEGSYPLAWLRKTLPDAMDTAISILQSRNVDSSGLGDHLSFKQVQDGLIFAYTYTEPDDRKRDWTLVIRSVSQP